MPTRRQLANAIRFLAMDAVQQAKSGHPGMPMGMADIAEVLWNDALRHNPANPSWPGRDRFVLSNGHGSMLLYALLHLTGYDLPMEELKNFRQLGSKTPGHPEYGMTPGVEATAGPLGQGIAMAVGMALAERLLAAEFNRDGFPVVDHRTFVFLGDGCLMEGVSHEACALAGTLGLSKLVAFYDDNGISIDGQVKNWFADDTPGRFEAYGWRVIRGVDGHDADAVKAALEQALTPAKGPTLVCCKTVIGFGAPHKAGTAAAHGAPLGPEEIAETRKILGWDAAPFVVPDDIRQAWDARARGAKAEAAWQEMFAAYAKAFPDMAAEFTRRMKHELPQDFDAKAGAFVAQVAEKAQTIASRKASELAIAGLAPLLPEFFGGSADLTESNLTHWPAAKTIVPGDVSGNYLSYGVREFGMGAIMNGAYLHGGLRPFGGTFLVFSDYMRSALRMAAIMNVGTIFVLTHDSIGLGEDGPTHQPVEHVASLRIIPNLDVWRPCDAVETAAAWKASVERLTGPSLLALSRQNLPHQPRDAKTMAAMERGGYVLKDCDGTPEAIVMATGSEVSLAVAAAEALTQKGRKVRVVSMPCLDRFEAQPAAYQESVLPPAVTARVAVEAGATASWKGLVGPRGKVVGLDRFGESAPGPQVMAHFGFTAENVTAVLEGVLAG